MKKIRFSAKNHLFYNLVAFGMIIFLSVCTPGANSFLNPKYDQHKIQKIALLPVSQTSGISIDRPTGQIQNTILDQLTIELMRHGRFQIVERSHINQLISEQSLSLSGISEDDKRHKIGALSGVDAIALVSISVYLGIAGTTDISLNFKIVDISTGEMIFLSNAKSDHGVVLLGTLGESINLVVNSTIQAIKSNFK